MRVADRNTNSVSISTGQRLLRSTSLHRCSYGKRSGPFPPSTLYCLYTCFVVHAFGLHQLSRALSAEHQRSSLRRGAQVHRKYTFVKTYALYCECYESLEQQAIIWPCMHGRCWNSCIKDSIIINICLYFFYPHSVWINVCVYTTLNYTFLRIPGLQFRVKMFIWQLRPLSICWHLLEWDGRASIIRCYDH